MTRRCARHTLQISVASVYLVVKKPGFQLPDQVEDKFRRNDMHGSFRILRGCHSLYYNPS
jgi:hypothetical protein